jgi:hypothetical protein
MVSSTRPKHKEELGWRAIEAARVVAASKEETKAAATAGIPASVASLA